MAKKKTKKTARKTTSKRPKTKAKAKAKATRTSSKRSGSAAKVKKSSRAASKKTAARPKTTKRKKVAKTTKKKTATKSPRTSSTARKATKRRPAAEATTTAAPARREPKLNSRDLDRFRQLLLEKRAEILGDVSTLHSEALRSNRSEASGDLSSMPIHMADLGTDNYELEFTLGLIEGERAMLREIDEALDRIRDGTYGYCLATGKAIGKARLKAKPWAKYCYEYTLARERGQTSGP